MTTRSMPVSLHCPLCLTVTVPGSSIIVEVAPPSAMLITAICPHCTRYLRIRTTDPLMVTRLLQCGARNRPKMPISPVEADRLAGGNWDEAAVEELMM